MEMFAKKLSVSFTSIVLVFTSCIAYNHADELPKFPFFDTPGSYYISRPSLGDTTKSPWNSWNSEYMPSVPPDFIQEFSSSQAQQPPSEVEDPVFKPAGLRLTGWGRIPRAPNLNGWGRIPRVPKFSHRGSDQLRLQPIMPQSVQQQKVWSAHVPSPPIRAPLRKSTPTFIPTTAERSPFEAQTSVTEPPTLNPAKPPSPALDLLDPPEWASSPTVWPPNCDVSKC